MGLLLLAGVGIVCIILGIPSFMAWRRMRGVEPTRVADLTPDMDIVEVVGTVRALKEPLRAPMTNKEAVVYWFKVQVNVDSAEDTHSLTHASDRDRQPFILDDGSGQIVIDPEGAAVNLDEQRWKVDAKDDPPMVIQRFLQESAYEDEATTEINYPYPRVFIAGQLEPDEEVYVYGPLQAGPADGAPESAITPYIGSRERLGEQENPPKKAAYGLAGESSVFTISDAGEKQAERASLTQAAVWMGVGAAFIALAVILWLT